MTPNKFLNYGRQFIDDDDIQCVVETLRSNFLTQGPKVREFEEALCDYTEAKYCVCVANGTAALHLSVAALEIEKGMEGITSPITFMASSNSLVYNGLIPRFVDIDPKTYLIDIKKTENTLTDKTRVIIPVHFTGQPVDMEKLSDIAKNRNVHIIEDAAHAIGSKYLDGTRVGNCQHSSMTIFSFHPVKTITTGEGGAITTNDETLYQKLLELRSHGITKATNKLTTNPGPWYHEMHMLGFNYRLTDIQAALGKSQLKKLDEFIKRRREIVAKYNEPFRKIEWLATPYEQDNVYSAFHLYVVQINFELIKKSRKQVMEILFEKGIGTQVHYIPVYRQPYYQDNYSLNINEYPKSEHYYNQCLSLPLYPDLKDEDVDYIIQSIKELF